LLDTVPTFRPTVRWPGAPAYNGVTQNLGVISGVALVLAGCAIERLPERSMMHLWKIAIAGVSSTR
jgi:hypothetical protein